MPRKLRELRADLRRAGFHNRGGKGDHQNWEHPRVAKSPWASRDRTATTRSPTRNERCAWPWMSWHAHRRGKSRE